MANCLRNVVIRKFSSCKSLRESMAEPLSHKPDAGSHAHDNSGLLWKRLFLFGCLPSILLAYINCKTGEAEKPPEFKKYSYLRIRNKPFPWGDGQRSLFHNPHTNALPDGYEHH